MLTGERCFPPFLIHRHKHKQYALLCFILYYILLLVILFSSPVLVVIKFVVVYLLYFAFPLSCVTV